MNIVMRTLASYLAKQATTSIFGQERSEHRPHLLEMAVSTLKRTLTELTWKAICALFSFAGFLMFYAELMRQFDQGFNWTARAIGFLALFMVASLLFFVPGVKRKAEVSAMRRKIKLQLQDLAEKRQEKSGPAYFENKSLPPLETNSPSGLEVLRQELRAERADMWARLSRTF